MDPERRSIEIRLIPDPEKKGPGTLEGTLLTYNERASDRPERLRLARSSGRLKVLCSEKCTTGPPHYSIRS